MRLAVTLAATLLLAGCSGSDGPDGPDESGPARDGLRALFARTSPESEAAAGCFADGLVDRRSTEQLTEDGILDEDGQVVDTLPPLDREAAAAWVDAWFDCTDFTEVAGRAQEKVTKTLDVAGFEECFQDRLTGDQIREAATDGLSGDTSSAAVRRLSRAQLACAEAND